MAAEHRVIQKSDDTGNDCRIGNVKDVPVVPVGVDGKKIRHGAVYQTVDQISNPPAKDKTQRGGTECRGRANEPHGHGDERGNNDTGAPV